MPSVFEVHCFLASIAEEKGHRGKGLAELKDALHSLDFRAAEDTVGKVTKSKV